VRQHNIHGYIHRYPYPRQAWFLEHGADNIISSPLFSIFCQRLETWLYRKKNYPDIIII